MKIQTESGQANKGLLRGKWIYPAACLAVSACLFALIQGYERPGGCDSRQYVDLARTFTANGHFSFLNFPKDVAGYAFPFLLFLMDLLTPFSFTPSHHHMGVELFSVLACVWLCGYFAERFLAGGERVAKRGIWGRVFRMAACSFLFYLFFRDLMAYPLSDLWPMFFAGVSFFLVSACKRAKTLPGGCLAAFALGTCSYLIYNIRQSWLFFLPFLWLAFVLENLANKKRLSAGLVFLVLGIAVAALPQVLINRQNFGVLSPFVTSPVQGFDSMFLYHLYGGTFTDRVETHVLPEWGEAANSVSASGRLLLAEAGATPENFGYLTYIKLLARNLFDYIGIYTRHIVSLITPLYTQIYVQNLESPFRLLVILTHYLIYTIVIWDIASRLRQRQGIWKKLFTGRTLFLFGFTLPALSAIPGYIEIRYGAPLILLAYLYLGQICSFRRMWRNVKKHWAAYLLPTAAVWALCLSVMGTILANFDISPLLLG